MSQLSKYDRNLDRACKAIAACTKPIEAKRIADYAESMRIYAKRAKNKDMEADCVEIRMRATRRVGQLMRAQRDTVGLARAGRPKTSKRQRRNRGLETPILPSLESQGIDKNLAKYARQLEDMTAQHFEELVSDARTMITNLLRRVISLAEGMDDRRAHAARARDTGGSFRDLQALLA